MQREISRNHTSDWDEQRERLSAYLDGELDGGEREALEQHLPACEQCQRTLDEFREVRALLRAMPVPATPRSFAIPTEGAIPVPLAAATSDRAGRTEQQQRRTRSGGIWSGVAQAVGGFVAAAGVILVLGSALTGTMQHQFSASMPASRSVGSGASQSGQYDNTSTASGAHPSPTTTAGLQQATPKTVEQNKGSPTPTTGTTVEPTRAAAQSRPENPPVVPIGTGMVAGGTVLFVAGRVSGNRRRRA